MCLLVAVDIVSSLIYCVGEMSWSISLANLSTLFVGVRVLIFRIFFWIFVSSNASDGFLTSTIFLLSVKQCLSLCLKFRLPLQWQFLPKEVRNWPRPGIPYVESKYTKRVLLLIETLHSELYVKKSVFRGTNCTDTN